MSLRAEFDCNTSGSRYLHTFTGAAFENAIEIPGYDVLPRDCS